MALQKIEVKVISREMIQPSSQTPSHLRCFKLSLLDQYSNPMYSPAIFHYPQTDHNGRRRIADNAVDQLRHSLAKTLSIYYPLAGRVKDNMFVDCNDEGALFLESRVNVDMATFLKRPDLDSLYDFVPFDMLGQSMQSTDTLVPVVIQVNVFTCGGISIGCFLSHKIIDGATTISFLKCWAAIMSGQHSDDKFMRPDLATASVLFPPRMLQTEGTESDGSWIVNDGPGVLRRFVFDSRAVRELKAAAASPLVPNPSASVVVACFIWKCIMNASEKEKGSKQPWMIVAPKNVRPLTTPPMSQESVGNIVLSAIASYDPPAPPQLERLVSSLREGYENIDVDYVRKLQGDKDLAVVHKMMNNLNEFQSRKKRKAIIISSAKALKYTEIDFGWGKPIWISHIRMSFHYPFHCNLIVLGDTARGTNGMEAWLVLGEKTMGILESDPEFLAYASRNPSIAQLVGRL